jgi:hypothetical protein
MAKAAAVLATTRGGGGTLEEGGGALAPLFLGLGAGVEEPLPLFAAAKGEVNL